MKNEREDYITSLPANITYEPVETVHIGSRLVGKGQPFFVIAEIGSNHRGNIENALQAIALAKDAGADAVKFQHLTHDKIAADTPASFQWKGKHGWKTLADFYTIADLPYEWTDRLVAEAKRQGIIFLSTPFDKEAADVLDAAGAPAFKVASYEMTDDIFLRYIAQKGKPIILSTGMATLEEVAHAVRVIQIAGNNQIVLLHCVSIYPPKDFADLNLRAITTLRDAFKLPVGYSDHSDPLFIAAPIVALTLGACVLERHLTDNREGGSNDDSGSLTVSEFRHMVLEMRNAEKSLSGSGVKQPVSHVGHKFGEDEVNDTYTRRAVYAARDINAGEKLTENMVITLRPCFGGIAPKDFEIVRGRTVRRAIKSRSPITFDDFMD